MTEDEVISAVVRYIAQVTGVVAIRAHQSGKAPVLPYVMVNFTGMAEVREHARTMEYAETGQTNTAGKAIIRATPVIEMEWRFSVHAYGENPGSILRPILSAIKHGTISDPNAPGVVFFDASPIRSIPEWINNNWEPRAQVDLFARGVIRDATPVGVIDTIDTTTFDIHPMA